jgi:hypothetical protein
MGLPAKKASGTLTIAAGGEKSRSPSLTVRSAAGGLGRDDVVLRMQENGLFGRQVPLVAEALAAVARAEPPEGRIPWCAVPFGRVSKLDTVHQSVPDGD